MNSCDVHHDGGDDGGDDDAFHYHDDVNESAFFNKSPLPKQFVNVLILSLCKM